ncbi:ropporin-1-like protein, partial [Lasius niger]
EEETTSSGTDEDVCGEAPSEKRASESLEILKDHGDDPKHSDVDTVSARQSVAGDKTEIEIESIHRHNSREGERDESTIETNVNESSAVSSINDHTEHYNSREDLSKRDDDAFDSDEVEKRILGEAEAIERTTTTTSIDLKSHRELGEPEGGGQTPPPDPLKEFLKRMRAEVEAGRLETIFRVSGIGPPISTERVTAVGLWLTDCARRQRGLVGPRNIRHFLCPNLDDVSECACA